MDKLVTFRGVEHKYYLDSESERALPESLLLEANWLIHIHKHRNTTPQNEEKKEVVRFISKLESAIKVYSDLALNNQGRILNGKAKDILGEILEAAKAVDIEPLAKKATLENLYKTFYTMQHKDLGRKTFGRDDKPTAFQIFMAVVVRHAENEESKGVDQFVSRVTKAYQRLILGQS